MDKIYSRKKIKLPKILYKNFNIQKNYQKKKIKFFIILIIIILTFTVMTKSVGPVFEKSCKDKARSIATIICNEETTKIVENYKYEDLVTIYKDNEGNITMIKSNIVPINLIISDVAENIQNRINQVDKNIIAIRLGSFTGSKILSGLGPTIPIQLSTTGNIKTDLRSELKSVGINQSIHRLYLQIDCEIKILTPYNDIEENVSNQFLIAENVVLGRIPETYYNLEGINSGNVLDVLE